jgi:hypothetical protein
MTYTAKAPRCSEIRKKTQRKASTLWNFLVLSLVVRKGTARL